MATFAHTPGPWRVRLGTKGQPVGIEAPADAGVPGAVGHIVRQNGIGLPSSPVAIANAKLIAAAPDLYEAAEEGAEPRGADFLDWLADRLVFQYGESPNVDFVLALRRKAQKTRAAVAKADGRA